MGLFIKGSQPARSATEGVRLMLAPGNAEAGMSKSDFPAVERMVANTINETRRRDWIFQDLGARRGWGDATISIAGERAAMWPLIAGVAVVLAQAAQPGPGSKGYEWCFERGQGGAQLCEATEAACNHLWAINPEIATSPCRRVEPPENQVSPTEPPAPPNPEGQTPTQR